MTKLTLQISLRICKALRIQTRVTIKDPLRIKTTTLADLK
jgi:hypothetical protein